MLIFHVVGGVGVSLLSLIPRLIRHRVPVWGMVWVWLGGTLLLRGSNMVRSFRGRRLGTLLGPEETPVVGVVLWSAPGPVV